MIRTVAHKLTMKHFSFFLGLLFLSSLSWASTALDHEYGYRTIAAAVTNVEKEPVFGEHVENEIVGFLRSNLRFEFSDQGYLLLREKIRPIRKPSSELPANTMLDPLKPTLQQLDKIGVSAVVLGEVARNNDGEYEVVIQLATTKGQESAFSYSAKVDGNSLENFGTATRNALGEMMKWMPFDASIIKRDGVLVVLDRGLPAFQKGQQLSTYTVEKKTDGILFEESGVIGLTQVGDQISFGRILVERRPLEVSVGNKIRSDNKPVFRVSPSLWSTTSDRDLASAGPSFEVTKGKFGVFNANVGPALVSYETQNKSGSEKSQMSSIYPTLNLTGEVWLTSRITFSMGFKYGVGGKKEVGGTTKEQVGTSLSSFRVLGGYRINLLAPDPGPILHFKLGYAKDSFGFDSTKELIFTGMTYSGILVGGGVAFPVNDRIGLGFDVESLIFPGVVEEKFKSGENVSNVSAWNFGVKGTYRYDREIDFEAKLFLQRNGAEFSGDRTRLFPYTMTSQVSRGLSVGMSYYF